MEVIARDNHILILVNGQTLTDYVDEERRFTSGSIALHRMMHSPQTIVEFRKIEIKDLSAAKPSPAGAANSEPDPIGGRLANAKNSYDAKFRTSCETVLKALERKENAARTAGDKKLLDELKEQRDAFEARTAIPTIVPTTEFMRQLRGARFEMATAYGVAIRGYTKARMDDAVAAVERDLATFRRGVPPPFDAKSFGGKHYKLFVTWLNWQEAQAKCVEMGGHLPIVLTGAENQFLTALTNSAGLESTWLGATDEKSEGEWRWVNDAPLGYSNWERGQPNNNSDGLPENYAVLLIALNGRWYDYPDNGAKSPSGARRGVPGFICQWD
jgi:hypothetical protein